MTRFLAALLAVGLTLFLPGHSLGTQNPDIEFLTRSVVYITREADGFIGGWILDQDGIITVAHGLPHGGDVGERVTVIFRDGEVVEGIVTWADKRRDLAVVSAPVPEGYAAASLSCDPAPVGEPVLAIGHPLRLLWTVSFGRMSSTTLFLGNRTIVQLAGAYGISGAPVFNHAGQVIGMVRGLLIDGPLFTGFITMIQAAAICETGLTS